jgi:crotonobetainyl-CoA:carnitine CoA-transferase CaiB-like acyl-CoA transferase
MMRHAKALYAMLRPIIATRTTEDWMQFCARHGIPAGRVATLDEMVAALPKADHPVVGPWRVIPAPIWFSGAQSRPVTPAGRVGEETLAVLREAGFAPDQIEAMIESGAALTPSAPAPSATGGGDG